MAIVERLFSAMINRLISISMAENQRKMDEQLEMLKATNTRANHITLSLYNEEKAAIKEISGKLCAAMAGLDYVTICLMPEVDVDYFTRLDECKSAFKSLSFVIDSNVVFLPGDLFRQLSKVCGLAGHVITFIDRYFEVVEKNPDEPMQYELSKKVEDSFRETIAGYDTAIALMLSTLEAAKRMAV